MNNLILLPQFVNVKMETKSLQVLTTRRVLLLCCTLFLVTWSSQAQTPTYEPKTVTLEELQHMALQSNPTFAQSAANIQAAEGRKKQSGLYPNPTIGYQGEEIRGGSFR